jgi:hypothetical protein
MRDAVETFYYLFIFRFSQETYFQGNSSKPGRVYLDEKKYKRVPGCISPSRASRSGSKREDTTLTGRRYV